MKPDDNLGPGPGQLAWAAAMAITGLLAFFRQASIVSILGGCGCLLYAWSLTCYPVAGFRSILRAGSQRHINRYISPLFVTVVMTVGLGLMAFSAIMFFI